MDNFDYKTKYLKYKTKYISLKNNSQAGGERHNNIIRKDGNIVTYPEGFPDLSSNGDYHVVHAYDPVVNSDRNKLSKIEILQVWVNQTFPQAGQPPGDLGEHINKTWNLYNSDVKQDFIDLVNWLNDPTDN